MYVVYGSLHMLIFPKPERWLCGDNCDRTNIDWNFCNSEVSYSLRSKKQEDLLWRAGFWSSWEFVITWYTAGELLHVSSGFYSPVWFWFLFINLFLDAPIYNDILFHIMLLKSWCKNLFYTTWSMNNIIVL